MSETTTDTPRVCARCRKALARKEPVQCFTPSWCANWPGTKGASDVAGTGTALGVGVAGIRDHLPRTHATRRVLVTR